MSSKLQNIITDALDTSRQNNYLTNMAKCKTGKLGYSVSMCEECGKVDYHALACRNRNCPICQNRAREKWIESQKESAIRVKYYHVVATIPNVLHDIFRQNKKEMYKLLMEASAESLMELSEDEKYVGGKIGIIQMLHTWNQQIHYHPHAHMLVPAIGIDKKGNIIIDKRNFLVPVKAYSKKYRGKFISKLKKIKKKLKFKGELRKYENEEVWEELINKLYEKKFVTYIKKPYKNPDTVIEYFGRYAYKVAISESRIIKYEDGMVTYKYKDRKDQNKEKEETITGKEFVKRFSMHILPSGFRKIRGYGILSNRNKKERIKKIKEELKKDQEQKEVEKIIEEKSKEMYRCPCGGCYKFIKKVMTLKDIYAVIEEYT